MSNDGDNTTEIENIATSVLGPDGAATIYKRRQEEIKAKCEKWYTIIKETEIINRPTGVRFDDNQTIVKGTENITRDAVNTGRRHSNIRYQTEVSNDEHYIITDTAGASTSTASSGDGRDSRNVCDVDIDTSEARINSSANISSSITGFVINQPWRDIFHRLSTRIYRPYLVDDTVQYHSDEERDLIIRQF